MGETGGKRGEMRGGNRREGWWYPPRAIPGSATVCHAQRSNLQCDLSKDVDDCSSAIYWQGQSSKRYPLSPKWPEYVPVILVIVYPTTFTTFLGLLGINATPSCDLPRNFSWLQPKTMKTCDIWDILVSARCISTLVFSDSCIMPFTAVFSLSGPDLRSSYHLGPLH